MVSIVKGCLSRVKNKGDIPNETLEYFFINKPKLGRFYLLPKIHKRLRNVPGIPVISNSGFSTEKLSAFLEYHLKPLSQKFCTVIASRLKRTQTISWKNLMNIKICQMTLFSVLLM